MPRAGVDERDDSVGDSLRFLLDISIYGVRYG